MKSEKSKIRQMENEIKYKDKMIDQLFKEKAMYHSFNRAKEYAFLEMDNKVLRQYLSESQRKYAHAFGDVLKLRTKVKNLQRKLSRAHRDK